jgi:hypothetical protein
MSPLEDLFAEAEAPADTSKAKLSKLFSEAEATPKAKSRYSGLFAGEGEGRALRGAQSSNGLRGAFGSGPLPSLEDMRKIPGLAGGAMAIQAAQAIPGAIDATIKSVGRSLPHLPGEATAMLGQVGQSIAHGNVVPTELIKQQAEDIMEAQAGNQEAQDRINARSLIHGAVMSGAMAPAAPLLSGTERMLMGGTLGAAQNAALAGVEGRDVTPADLALGFGFGAFTGVPHAGVPEPIPGIRPQAVMSAETQYAAQNLLEKLKTAKPLIGVQGKLRKQVLGERLGKATEAAQGLTGEARLRAELSQLKGPLPRVSVEPLNLAPEDRAQLLAHLENLQTSGQMKQLQSVNARRALLRLFGEQGSALPRPHEIKLMRQAFGARFAMQLAGKGLEVAEATEAKNLPQWRTLAKQVTGSARELKTTADLSFPFRQGWFLISHPREFAQAFKEMHKYAFNREYFEHSMENIMDRPTFPLMQDAGVEFERVGGTVQSLRAEPFQGGLLERLPRWLGGGIVRGSQRAYTGAGNLLRADVFDDMLRQGTKIGLTPDELAPHVADFVNVASGRGKIPTQFGLEKASEALSHALFAPRLISSRIQLLGTPLSYLKSLASGDKAYRFVRQQAMKDFLVMGGLASTMLGLAAAAGAKVQRNPTHGDYGKMRMGNQVVDLLGGFGQFIRPAARIHDEIQYSNQTGKPGRQGNVLMRLGRSKEAPIPQFANDMFLGEDFQGNKVTLPSAIANLVGIMSIGDAWSAIQDNPRTAMVTVPLTIYGASYQKYKQPQPYQPGKKGY